MKTKGFTLIELVVAIVIMSILAAFAVPKFVNLRHDANVAALKTFVANFESSVKLIYLKAQISGEAKSISVKDADNELKLSKHGYPKFFNMKDLEKITDVPEVLKPYIEFDEDNSGEFEIEIEFEEDDFRNRDDDDDDDDDDGWEFECEIEYSTKTGKLTSDECGFELDD